MQNVGAYGQEVSSTINHVRTFDLKKHAYADCSAQPSVRSPIGIADSTQLIEDDMS